MQFWPWVNIVPKLNVAPIYEGVGILVIAFRITKLIALQTLLNNYKLWWHISAPYAKVTYLFYFSTNLVFDMQEQYVTLFMCNINNFGLQGMKQDHWRIKKKPKNDKKNLTPPKKPTINPHNCNRGEPILESLRRSVLFIAILRSHSFIQWGVKYRDDRCYNDKGMYCSL